MTRTADESFARSVRFWLRAYPWHWREERGAELTAVLTDLAAPGARRLDARSAAGLVRGGLATRRRVSPPLVPYLGYVTMGTRVPPEYASWVWHDVRRPHYRWLRAARPTLSSVLVVVSWLMNDPRAAVAWAGVLVVATVAGTLATDPARLERSVLRSNLAPAPGRRAAPGSVRVEVPRRRLHARDGSTVLLGSTAAGAVTWSVTAWWTAGIGSAVTRQTVVPRMLVVAAAAGVVAAAIAVLHHRTSLAAPPEQPDRVVVRLQPGAPVGLVLCLVLLVAEAVLEVTGVFPIPLSVAGAALCTAALPAALVIWLRARRTSGDARTVAVDLVRGAVAGRPPRVDEPESLWVMP